METLVMTRQLVTLILIGNLFAGAHAAHAATSSAVASIQGSLAGGNDPVTVTLPAVSLISATATVTYQINSGTLQTLPAGNVPASFTINQGDTFGIAAVAAASSGSPLYSRAWALQDVLFSPNGDSGVLSFLANSSVQLQGIGTFGNAYTQSTTIEAIGAGFLATHFEGKPGTWDFSGDQTFQSKLFAEASVPAPEPTSMLLAAIGTAIVGGLRRKEVPLRSS
ncbi:MAG: PEP-CTERM sorting domain-containing protein [Planctomycetales bacterium]|nr:PEP-CTERM sorting domain-containing protein [Planctomycetales bacterium]